MTGKRFNVVNKKKEGVLIWRNLFFVFRTSFPFLQNYGFPYIFAKSFITEITSVLIHKMKTKDNYGLFS